MPKSASDNEMMISLYTDFKLHDITSGGTFEDSEPLDMNHSTSSPGFATGNSKFLTKRLWGAANEPPYFHHGRFTTLRQAVLAHHGEASDTRRAFLGLDSESRSALIEFLKSLQVAKP